MRFLTFVLKFLLLFCIRCYANVFSLHVLADFPSLKCLVVSSEINWLWHRRLGHCDMDLISKLARKNLVRGLPQLGVISDKFCDACKLGKQHRGSFHLKKCSLNL